MLVHHCKQNQSINWEFWIAIFKTKVAVIIVPYLMKYWTCSHQTLYAVLLFPYRLIWEESGLLSTRSKSQGSDRQRMFVCIPSELKKSLQQDLIYLCFISRLITMQIFGLPCSKLRSQGLNPHNCPFVSHLLNCPTSLSQVSYSSILLINICPLHIFWTAESFAGTLLVDKVWFVRVWLLKVKVTLRFKKRIIPLYFELNSLLRPNFVSDSRLQTWLSESVSVPHTLWTTGPLRPNLICRYIFTRQNVVAGGHPLTPHPHPPKVFQSLVGGGG